MNQRIVDYELIYVYKYQLIVASKSINPDDGDKMGLWNVDLSFMQLIARVQLIEVIRIIPIHNMQQQVQ